MGGREGRRERKGWWETKRETRREESGKRKHDEMERETLREDRERGRDYGDCREDRERAIVEKRRSSEGDRGREFVPPAGGRGWRRASHSTCWCPVLVWSLLSLAPRGHRAAPLSEPTANRSNSIRSDPLNPNSETSQCCLHIHNNIHQQSMFLI